MVDNELHAILLTRSGSSSGSSTNTMLVLILLITLVNCQPSGQLLVDRLHCVELLIVRATSYPQLLLAYANCTTNDVTHTVRDVGDFGPGRTLALEYDEIVNIFPLIGIPSPVTLRPAYDENTIVWLDNDTIRVDYIINITLNPQPEMQGFRYSTFLVFGNSTTDRVKLIYDIQDPAAIELFSGSDVPLNPYVICAYFVFPACVNHIADTGYTSVDECAAFMSTVLARSKCPFQGRSNTASCRTTHSWAAFIRPEIHCSHVSRVNPVCADTCYPACDNCDSNAECVATFPTLSSVLSPALLLSSAVYQCRCKNGYRGDGLTCTARTNSHGLPHGTFVCLDGVCKCTETFTWSPFGLGTCTCEDGLKWQDKCIPTGRCLEKKHCPQERGTVDCLTYGVNNLTEWKHCLCNRGYKGGWEYPCTCSGTEVHTLNGKICLAPGECTQDRHCASDETCENGSCVTRD